MTEPLEFGDIFKRLVVKLESNFNKEFYELNLYKSVAKFENRSKKMIPKYVEKLNFKDKIGKIHDSFLQESKEEKEKISKYLIDSNICDKLKNIPTLDEIEKLDQYIMSLYALLVKLDEEQADYDAHIKRLDELNAIVEEIKKLQS